MSLCRLYLLPLVMFGALSGCATSSEYVPPPDVSAEKNSPLVSASYDAVDALIKGQTLAPIVTPNGGRGILVATLADINNLKKSSGFGRLLSEQISSRIAQLRIPVNELKLRENLFVHQTEGEFLLSRQIKEIGASQNADLVLVGTYADGGGAIYVTLKLVRASDSRVSNAYNFSIIKSEAVRGLLKESSNDG